MADVERKDVIKLSKDEFILINNVIKLLDSIRTIAAIDDSNDIELLVETALHTLDGITKVIIVD